jgi:hypothetical protein
MSKEIVPVERIAQGIFYLRGQRVMLSQDLATLYGVAVKALNQAVRRHSSRFPTDFVFQLTSEEFVGAGCGELFHTPLPNKAWQCCRAC